MRREQLRPGKATAPVHRMRGPYMNPAPPVMRILSGTKSSALDSKVVDSSEASQEALLSTGDPLPAGSSKFGPHDLGLITNRSLPLTIILSFLPRGAHRDDHVFGLVAAPKRLLNRPLFRTLNFSG